MQLNLAGFVKYSTANGPGRRAVVWVQGCHLRCKGCFNPGLQPFRQQFHVPPDVLAEEIAGVNGIEGVTFTGGEPFCQARALAETGRYIRRLGLNVVTFTGFAYETIRQKKRNSWESLIGVTDLLIAGPYEPDAACRHPLLSSSNQELVYVTDVFVGREVEVAHVPDVEYIIRPGGETILTGFPGAAHIPADFSKKEQECHISQGLKPLFVTGPF
jgi:anaerobic ribonucleoside-triphosphate reductase activating protein